MSDLFLYVPSHQNDFQTKSGQSFKASSDTTPANAKDELVATNSCDLFLSARRTPNYLCEGVDNDLFYKMSHDSLDMISGQDSPLDIKQSTLICLDTDSYASISPSPDPDCKAKTFDFSMIDTTRENRNDLSAALQVEQEFLDFMFSLPQIQKEAQAKLQQHSAEATVPKAILSPHRDDECMKSRREKKSPTRASLAAANSSRVGLDHLDNLCRMMEQLGELREQNTRLQRRVQYLEDLKTLQEMHRDMQDSIAARKTALSLGSVSLSDSDLRLEDLNDSAAIYRMDSEDSLDPPSSATKIKGKGRAKEKLRTRSHSLFTGNSNSSFISSSTSRKNKVSRWSRVREAFKWERVSALPDVRPLISRAKETHHLSVPLQSKTTSTLEENNNPPSPTSSDSSIPSQSLTEEGILNSYRLPHPITSDSQILDIPETPNHLQRYSSSEEERRPGLEKGDLRRPTDKEKKGHKSAWGKVKNIISYNSKRDSVRKKSSIDSEANRKSTSSMAPSASAMSIKSSIQDTFTGVGVDGVTSDPEEYDIEYESAMDLDGTSLEGDADAETGIWMGPPHQNLPEKERLSLHEGHIRKPRKGKPHLTITVPSNENLAANLRMDSVKTGEDFPGTPPSPKRASNWTKVKQAFLTGHQPNHPSNHLRQNHQISPDYRENRRLSNVETSSSQPPSPYNKKLVSTFSFDSSNLPGSLATYESDSPSGVSPDVSPDELVLRSQMQGEDCSRTVLTARHSSLPFTAAHKNLADLQQTLTGEFNKKLQEWEKLKYQQGINCGWSEITSGGVRRLGSECNVPGGLQNAEGNLPHDFKKKLHEWEKLKGKDKEKYGNRSHSHHHYSGTHFLNHHSHNVSNQDNVKMKKHDEDDLPPDFKKKLTEWQIRKALVGKGQPNVDKLQKNLGEEFNKKMVEWEKMKTVAQGKMSALEMSESGLTGSSPTTPTAQPISRTSVSSSSIPTNMSGDGSATSDSGVIRLRELARLKHSSGVTGAVPESQTSHNSGLDRKASASKVKKSKAGKAEKVPLTKNETQKQRDKELLWLEKELSKIDREKQRLEREKEKFLEREARLERMRHAMRQGPAEKKEIYIKTSTGEFRFEGISQTFTKKLYEWEERRGIRPESSTFVLLDPDYKAPQTNGTSDKPRSPETKRTARSRSESSLAEMGTSTMISHQSCLSLNDKEEESSTMQGENKSASEPTLTAEEIPAVDKVKCAVLVQMEEVVEEELQQELKLKDELQGQLQGQKEDETLSPELQPEITDEVFPQYMEEPAQKFLKLSNVKEGGRSRSSSAVYTPYAPAEITKLIDSSGSEDNLTRHLQEAEDDLSLVTSNGMMSTEKTLRRSDSQRSEESYRSLLHENMTLLGRLKEQESLCRALETQMGDIDSKMDNVADQHLKTLEKLHRQVSIMKKSENSTKMSENDESEESGDAADEAKRNQRLIEQLKSRIVELEMKGDKLMEEKEELEAAFSLHKEHEAQIAESLLMRIRELQDAEAEVNIQTVQCQTDNLLEPEESHKTADEPRSEKRPTEALSPLTKKRRRKKRDDQRKNYNDEETNEEEREVSDVGKRKCDKEEKEQEKRKKKMPHKKVQKLHNMTAELLFQAKRLEAALVTRHNLSVKNRFYNERLHYHPSRISRKRSLKGRNSFRLTNNETIEKFQTDPPKNPGSARTWSSIEALATAEESNKENSASWESRASALASESQELLAMNAELSRMAKELRNEMLNLWSYRESTSPESNSSDAREEFIKARRTKSSTAEDQSDEETIRKISSNQDRWLVKEAREVFDSIASLQKTQSAPDFSSSSLAQPVDVPSLVEEVASRQKVSTPKIRENFNPWSKNKISAHEEPSEIEGLYDVPTCETEEQILSWWDVPLPKKRKSKPKLIWNTESTEDMEEEVKKNKEESFVSEQTFQEESKDEPSTLCQVKEHHSKEIPCNLFTEVPLIAGLRTNSENLSKKDGSERNSAKIDEANGLPSCEPILLPFRSHSWGSRSGTSSSASEDKESENYMGITVKDDEAEADSERETTTPAMLSSVRDDIISSSFEYEDTNSYLCKENKENQIFKEFQEFCWEDNMGLMTYPPAKKSEFIQKQLDRVGLMIADATQHLQLNGKPPTQQRKQDEVSVRHKTCKITTNGYETEVNPDLIKANAERGGLRTRRVSDTQVAYDLEVAPNPRMETEQSRVELYKEKYFYFRKVDRTPSVRRNQSESDVLGMNHESEEDSTNVFVRTHRTIFTVASESDSANSTATPTFFFDADNPDRQSNEDLLQNQLSSKLTNRSSVASLATRDPVDNDVSRELPVYSEDDAMSCDVIYNETVSQEHNETHSASVPSRSSSDLHFSATLQHCTSPTVSKRKVLEAANKTSPTVKNMIEQYNKRITEKQELLINPFKPGDPYRRSLKSASNTNKSLAILHKERSTGAREKIRVQDKILKSCSTTALPVTQPSYQTDYPQRSINSTSGVPETTDYETDLMSAETFMTSGMKTVNQSLSSFALSGAAVLLDRELAVAESSCDTSSGSFSLSESRQDQGKIRAIKMKKAKEEFLARGTNLATTNTSHGNENLISERVDGNRQAYGSRLSGTESTSVMDSDPLLLSVAPTKPPRIVGSKYLCTSRQESFRRQSEGSIPKDQSFPSQVMKSASSGVIELRHHITSRLTGKKEERKSAVIPSNEPRKASRGILKLFKRSRGKDNKALPTVQRLCRQSLTVALNDSSSRDLGQDAYASTSSHPPTQLETVRIPEKENGLQSEARCSLTLPRAESQTNSQSSLTKSCPSSPAAVRKSKSTSWLKKGKRIFKSRSPSPHQKQS